MNIPTDIKVGDLTQDDLDALIAAYNRLDNALTSGDKFCARILMDGYGVENADVRFHNAMLTHAIKIAYAPALDGEQE